jgi:plasmid stability protein
MASLTIQHIEDSTEARLRSRAEQHGRSVEDEAREILERAVAEDETAQWKLGQRIHERFAGLGGLDLPELERDSVGDPPAFG